MPYKANINFTLDTVCPFTYLAKKRLDNALKANQDPKVEFNVVFKPFQLSPEASREGFDKWDWYVNEKFMGSNERMKAYVDSMTAKGSELGIKFSFKGTSANTFEAHRLIQHVQENGKPGQANALVDALYTLYFEEEKHPSSTETLLEAAKSVGLDEKEVTEFLESREGVQDTKMAIREQVGNGVDSVPTIIFEGRKRDFTIVGTQDSEEYGKIIQQLIKEI